MTTPNLDEYRKVWQSDLVWDEKVEQSRRILPDFDIATIVLDYHIGMEVETNGDCTLAWTYHLLNLSSKNVSSDTLRVWSTNPNTYEEIDFYAVDLDHSLGCEVQVTRDLPNFKQLLVVFPLQIGPSQTLRYRSQCHLKGECVEVPSFYYEADVTRPTNKLTVSVKLPPGMKISRVKATEIGASGEQIDTEGKLDILTSAVLFEGQNVEQQTIEWVKDFPIIGVLYRIVFPPQVRV